ncbi:MAG TPA: large conductance mechanosensitive channel protein MscL [Anaerolineae bacterium]|nr:large conductance mechanosensitive channel protein MscL [Anaerolineae bacterium]
MIKEFRSFIMRGNVIDLAVAFIMGGAFGAIISSLVKDIIMPVVGVVLGGVDFTNLFITLKGGPFASLADAQKAGAATVNYGVFINTIITFLIVALAMFMLIKGMNAMRRPAPAAAPTTKECPYCLSTVPLKAIRCPNCTSELKS